MSQRIRIPFSSTTNTRDLGGYPINHHEITKWQRYYRSDYPKFLHEEDLLWLAKMQLTAVIDLRTDEEVSASLHPFSNHEMISYYHLSLFDSFDSHNEKVGNVSQDEKLKMMYISILNEEKVRVKKVFDVLLKHTDGSILFHCTAGKDRTGMIAMLLLGLAGVSDEDIIANYEVSFTHNRNSQEMKELAKRIPLHYFESNRDYMEETLHFFRETFGSFKAYFQSLGYDDKQIDQLKQSMIESA